jgi:hypothetical protein
VLDDLPSEPDAFVLELCRDVARCEEAVGRCLASKHTKSAEPCPLLCLHSSLMRGCRFVFDGLAVVVADIMYQGIRSQPRINLSGCGLLSARRADV